MTGLDVVPRVLVPVSQVINDMFVSSTTAGSRRCVRIPFVKEDNSRTSLSSAMKIFDLRTVRSQLATLFRHKIDLCDQKKVCVRRTHTCIFFCVLFQIVCVINVINAQLCVIGNTDTDRQTYADRQTDAKAEKQTHTQTYTHTHLSSKLNFLSRLRLSKQNKIGSVKSRRDVRKLLGKCQKSVGVSGRDSCSKTRRGYGNVLKHKSNSIQM